MKPRLLLIIGIICVPIALFSATFTVTHTLDSGIGSLRNALTLANADASADTILFDIPDTDLNYNASLNVWTIKPDSALPEIVTDGILIDGFSQIDSLYEMAIELNGTAIVGNADGLSIKSANNIIQGLSIGGFHGNAIKIASGSASGNHIYGCYLGLKLPGSKASGYKELSNENYSVYESRGIYIGEGSSTNVIGGVEEWQRNVISYNYYEAILVDAGASNVIVNNYIGTAANGIDAMGNGWIDVYRYRPDDRIVDRCPAIRISNGSIYNTIGGDSPNARNIICASGNAGIILQDSETSYNEIKANYIGLGADGSNAPYGGNSYSGIIIKSGATENQVGGDVDEKANYITANAYHGIFLYGLTTNNIISRNYIGLNGTRTTRVGNQLDGIRLQGATLGSPQANLIGPNNMIAGNYNYGIYIQGSGTLQNTITENLVYENLMGGIKLTSGGNTELSAPIISSAGNQVTGTTIPNGKVEFFSADGMKFLGSKSADSAGDFTWDSGSHTDPVIATVTDTNGNTSEFSDSVELPVEFAAFSASFDKGYVILNWSTESESNNFGFYVEKKIESWQSIGFVPGTGTTSEKSSYQFVDEDPGEGEYEYRLRQVDFDGAVSYSNIVSAANVTPDNYYLASPYPNPFNMELSFVIGVAREASINVEVYNTLGQRVRVLADKMMTVGEHRMHWNGFSDDGAIVPSGLYFIRMQSPGFSSTKQVLLIK